jgi:hypothetical protein
VRGRSEDLGQYILKAHRFKTMQKRIEEKDSFHSSAGIRIHGTPRLTYIVVYYESMKRKLI